jgi:hypothetical protein
LPHRQPHLNINGIKAVQRSRLMRCKIYSAPFQAQGKVTTRNSQHLTVVSHLAQQLITFGKMGVAMSAAISLAFKVLNADASHCEGAISSDFEVSQ